MSPQGQTKIPDSFGDSCDKWYEHSNKHSSSIQDHAGESTQRSVNIQKKGGKANECQPLGKQTSYFISLICIGKKKSHLVYAEPGCVL